MRFGMKRIMISLIPLFLIACNANNADYVTKQEFDEYKSSMEKFIMASNENIHTNQKELISKTDKHQLDINSLVKDLDSLNQKVSILKKKCEDPEVSVFINQTYTSSCITKREFDEYKNHTHTSSGSSNDSSSATIRAIARDLRSICNLTDMRYVCYRSGY